jgi:hypothetical protein
LAGAAANTYWDDVSVTPLPPNGDFETASLSPWAIAGGNAVVGTVSHSGGYAATLGGTTTQSWIYQDVAGLIPGQQYQVTAWVKSNTSSTNGVEVWLHDTQEAGIAYTEISPTANWQQITTLFTATNTGKLRIHLVQIPGTAETTYWDDIAVSPVSGSTMSASALSAPATASSLSPALANLLGPNTKLAAGSSKIAAKSVTQVPPFPTGTQHAKGSSADPVIPVSKTRPPQN